MEGKGREGMAWHMDEWHGMAACLRMDALESLGIESRFASSHRRRRRRRRRRRLLGLDLDCCWLLLLRFASYIGLMDGWMDG
jgi:hypothetical protein